MKVKLAIVLVLILAVLAGGLVWINKTGRGTVNNQPVAADVGGDAVEHFPADGQRVGKDIRKIP